MKKHSDLAFKIRKQDFTRGFMRKQGTIFLNSEQKIIYAEKRVNNFLNNEQKIIYAEKRLNNFVNNVEQKIILCKMLEIIYVENSEQFL